MIEGTYYGIIANSFSDFAGRVYDHIFDPIIPDTSMNAILITGYEPIVLKGELSAINDIDTDVDGLTDWDEVDVEHWVDAGLITYNDDNTIKLPTVEQCMLHAEKSYVVDALDRLQQEYGINFGVAISSKLVMPISSDPTHEDGDGDGYADGSIDVLGNGKINDPWPLKNNVHVYRLNNENSFVNIYDGTTTYYGGAQGWFSSDIKRDGGCGVVATANAFAYLSQQSKCQALYGYPDLSKASFSNYMEDISNYVEVLSIMGYSLGVWPCEKLIDGAVEYANTQGVPIQGSYIDGVFINRAVNDRATLIPNVVDMLMDNFPTLQSHKAQVYAVADHIVKQAGELLDLSGLTPEDEEENLEKAQTFIAEALEQDIPVLSLSFVNSSLDGITTFELNGNVRPNSNFQQHWVTITEMVVDDIQNTSTIKVSSWGRYAYLSLEDVVNNEMVYNAFAYFY